MVLQSGSKVTCLMRLVSYETLADYRNFAELRAGTVLANPALGLGNKDDTVSLKTELAPTGCSNLLA